MLTFHSILAPNPNHLSAMGRVTVQWTFLEKTIETLVWELAALKQPAAQAITTHTSLQQLIHTANALADQRSSDSPLQQELKKQLYHIYDSLRPKRNSVVHGIWGPTVSQEKIVLLETTARGVVKFKVGEEMAAEDILAIAAEIDQAHFKLTSLSFEISSYLGQVTTIHV